MDGNYSSGIYWSGQQMIALDKILNWYENGDDLVFYLAGFAGTGKTTLAKEVKRRIGGEVIFTSVTGRACAVMERNGCAPVNTIDSLIYNRQCAEYCADDPPCRRTCPGRCQYKRAQFWNRTLDLKSPIATADLVIADEVSMLSRTMGSDLLSFRRPTLVLGDIGQLPAIGDVGYCTNRQPDYHLTEIHRQAAESPVIQLATKARKGERLRRGRYGNSAVVKDIDNDTLAAVDQIIVGTNRTRHSINRRVRRQFGFHSEVPQPGEKLVCLKNHRDKDLRNGELYSVVEALPDGRGFVEMTLHNDTRRSVDVVAPEAGFFFSGNGSDLPEQPFDFGYAITCHKAQGSEWDDVLVFDESAVFRDNASRWLYTAITRAAERVVVVLP